MRAGPPSASSTWGRKQLFKPERVGFVAASSMACVVRAEASWISDEETTLHLLHDAENS
jgi:hypothetical protein